MRKRKASLVSSSEDPDWLTRYLNDAWEPTSSHLEILRTALIPHAEKFRDIYKPIRHKAIAHRAMESEFVLGELISKTLITDMNEILRFLHALLWAVRELAWNARPIDLTNFSNHDEHVASMNGKIEYFVRQLN